MSFIQDGEAHSASQSTLQTIQSLFEISIILLAKLRDYNDRLRQRDKEQYEAEQPQADPLSEQEKAVTNEMAAIAAIDALEQYGDEIQTETGELMRVFHAEGFVVAANAQDETGYPLYHLYTNQDGGQKEVLSFQREPKGEGFIFFETEVEPTLEQRMALVEAFQQVAKEQLDQSTERDSSLTVDAIDTQPAANHEQQYSDRNQASSSATISPSSGVSQVAEQLHKLGDLAPEGSRAVLVAHQLLKDSETALDRSNTAQHAQVGWKACRSTDGSMRLVGDNYIFRRDKDSSITVSYSTTSKSSNSLSSPEAYLYKMKSDGSIHKQSGVEWDRVAFKSMHDKMMSYLSRQQPNQQQAQRPSASSKEGR